MPRQQFGFIDLFAGCGGLSLGLSNAGWQGVFAIERDPHAFKTFEANFLSDDNHKKDWKFSWEQDWVPKGPNDLVMLILQKETKLRGLRGKIDLVVGGPPCQGFSETGPRKANDPRNRLFLQYIKFVDLVRPKLLLMENVRGIGFKFINHLGEQAGRLSTPSEVVEKKLGEAGYEVYSDLIYSYDFGVPQRRPRYILVGIRRDIARQLLGIDPFELLYGNKRDFLILKGLGHGDGNKVTTSEAISDLETRGKKLEVYPDWPAFKRISKPGYAVSAYQRLMRQRQYGKVPNSLRLPNHFAKTKEKFRDIIRACKRKNRRGTSLSHEMREEFCMKKRSLTVLHPDKPSHTLTTLPDDFLHYDEPRILTVREMARIQSFPDRFEFHGKYTTGGTSRTKEVPRYSQVGNAVPPLLAEVLGITLLELLRKAKMATKARSTTAKGIVEKDPPLAA